MGIFCLDVSWGLRKSLSEPFLFSGADLCVGVVEVILSNVSVWVGGNVQAL